VCLINNIVCVCLVENADNNVVGEGINNVHHSELLYGQDFSQT